MENILDHSGCLSETAMVGYAGDLLSKEDRFSVEKHLAVCLLCSDAVDGWMMVEKDKREILLNELKSGIEVRTREKENRAIVVSYFSHLWNNPGIRYSIAASLLLLCGIGYFLYVNRPFESVDKVITENIPEKEVPQENNTIITVPAEEKVAVKKMEPQHLSGETTVEKAGKLYGSGTDANKMRATADDAPPPPAAKSPPTGRDLSAGSPSFSAKGGSDSGGGGREAEEIDKQVSVTEETLIVETVQSGNTGIQEDNGERESAKKSETKTKNAMGISSQAQPDARAKFSPEAKAVESQTESFMNRAIEKYNEQNYSEAISIIEGRVLPAEPGNYDGLFYAGMSWFKQNRCEKSMEYFEKVLQIKSLKYYYETLWTKAQCLLKSGEKDKAKIMLDVLAGKENTFKRDAIKQLEEMK